MTFTKDNRLVKNYVLLLMTGIIVPDDIPALFNMREAVADALGLDELPKEWN